MDIIIRIWFWSNKFQQFFLKHINRRKIANIYTTSIPFTNYCKEKVIFEKIMSDPKARNFVALRTSCSIHVIVWRN